MPRPNIDVFGHCIMCGDRVIEEKVINGITQTVFKANRAEAEYMLNDGSKMRVTVCKKCKEALDGSENDYIMKAVHRGWQHELETYGAWTQDKKDNYLKNMKKLKVVVRSDNKQKDVLDKHLEDHKKGQGIAKSKKGKK